MLNDFSCYASNWLKCPLACLTFKTPFLEFSLVRSFGRFNRTADNPLTADSATATTRASQRSRMLNEWIVSEWVSNKRKGLRKEGVTMSDARLITEREYRHSRRTDRPTDRQADRQTDRQWAPADSSALSCGCIPASSTPTPNRTSRT